MNPLASTSGCGFFAIDLGTASESHLDRAVPTDDGRHRSLVTVLLYLNDADNFEGGATLFEDTTEAKRFAAVAPARGRVVLFEHDLWHSGAPVTAGTKLVFRTDVLFDAAAPKPPPAPAQSRDRAKGVRGLADAVAPDLADALDAIGLLDCGVGALLAPGRAAYAAMLADAPDARSTGSGPPPSPRRARCPSRRRTRVAVVTRLSCRASRAMFTGRRRRTTATH